MFPQPGDFQDETEALYALVAPLGDAALAMPTAFKGWSIGDILGHLHIWNWGADLSLAEPARFDAVFAEVGKIIAAGGSLRDFERRQLGALGGRALVQAWRDFAGPMAARFAAADPARRVRWAGPDMSVRSSITARLMETWAHGQAIYDLLGVVRRNADRIRNIVVLGVNTYEWSFKVRGQTPPAPKPHLRLTSPSGALWTWNEPSESDVIEGAAEDFCQVVTQVRNVADTGLAVRGASARVWMATAQCFAGPPEMPPAQGARRTASRRPDWA
ncbi:MAG: TIGR03084 family protein [Rhodospirillaceae bacterium]|nr:TIGR03084 family protein [Rhodospirillaceae bacterium]